MPAKPSLLISNGTSPSKKGDEMSPNTPKKHSAHIKSPLVTPKVGQSPANSGSKGLGRKFPPMKLSIDEEKATVSSNHFVNSPQSSPSKGAEVDYKLFENLFKNKRKIKITMGVHSTQGFRNSMEDEHFFIRDLDVKANIQTNFQNHSMFGVFDGHSGKDAATFCKYQIYKHICKNKLFAENVEKSMVEGFLGCDDAYHKYAVEDDKASAVAGCTGVVGYVRESTLYVANCGDSRAVLAVAGKCVPMSEDHKPTRPDEKKRIENLGGKVEFGRVSGLLAVSRAFGDFEYKQKGRMLVTAKPDVQLQVLHKDADFLILACDGLWDVITSKEAVKFVYALLLEQGDVTKVCERLVDKALDRRSMDNITCMIILFRELNI